MTAMMLFGLALSLSLSPTHQTTGSWLAKPPSFDGAKWITTESVVTNGTFAAYRLTVECPTGTRRGDALSIAADTKYWLYGAHVRVCRWLRVK